MAKVNWNSKSALNKNQDLLKQRVIKLGFAIEADAKKNCRDLGIVDTGRLRASISTNWTGSGQVEGEINRNTKAAAKTGDGVKQPMNLEGDFSVAVGTNVKYAPYHEYGTKKITARPYLRPAYRKNIKKFIQGLKK